MARRYQSEQSQILNISSVDNQSHSQDPFVQEIHNRYGIPLVQLQSIYVKSHSPRSKMYEDQSTELDYGQKLIVNHNILKEMVYMIDNKPAITPYIKNKSHQFKKGIDQHKMDDKLSEVKKKLEQLIQFIEEPAVSENPHNDRVRKSDINQISYIQSSLQYSRDISEEPRVKEEAVRNPISKSRDAYIRTEQREDINQLIEQRPIEFHSLDSAKEVTSQLLTDQWREKSQFSHQNLKKSLQRISEVQSGQTIERQSQPKQKKKQIHNEQSSIQNSKIMQHQQLDQTGQLILSTINKKTTKVSVIGDKNKLNSRESIPQRPQEYANGQKKSPFWREKNNKFQSLFLKPAISHQSIEQPKSFNRTRLKFDDFVRGFTFKSLQSSNNQLSVTSGKLDRLQSNEISRTSKPQFIRYDPVNNSISSSSLINSNHSLRAKNSLIKQSKIIQSFPSKHLDSPQKKVSSKEYIQSKPKGMQYLSQQVSNEQLKETAHFQQANTSALKQSFNTKASQVQHQVAIKRQYSVPYLAKKTVPNKSIIYQTDQGYTPQVIPNRRVVNPQYRVISPQLRAINKSTPTININNSLYSNQQNPTYVPSNVILHSDNLGRAIDRPIIYQKIVRRPQIFNQQPLFYSNPPFSRDTQRGKLKKKGIQLTNNLNKPYF